MTPQYGIPAPRYRLPDDTHVGSVRLQVSDLDRSLAFYGKVLGLRTITRGQAEAVLGPHGDDSPLIELHERAGARSVPRSGLLGLYHFAILLPDRASLGRFLAHLAEMNASPGMSDHFVSEAIYLQDPDNLGIEVYADRPRSEWRVEQGQLSMSTVPLDVPSVLAAGKDQPWAGMPPRTTIGHVHLHVGDIAEASRFYHDALGLDKMAWSYPGALFLSAGGYHHHLGTNTWARGAPGASAEDARLLEWELVLPAAAAVSAAALSMAAAYDVERSADAAAVRDPWGTQLRLRTV